MPWSRKDWKFPDMRALVDCIHAKGLKFGICSSPGPTTCQGLPGSYPHERIDVETWRVDYVKYDYCGCSRIAADRERRGAPETAGCGPTM
jgi:alpha-galactosidase